MKTCPLCGAEMREDAVLCIACGFHRERGHKLSTEVVPSRDLSNPFAPPEPIDAEFVVGERLSAEDAERARTIAAGAFPVYLSALLSLCICWPVMVLLLPWFIYRIAQWASMRANFPQLRNPNSLSAYVETEMQFQGAGLRYIVSIACGMIWLFLVISMLFIEYVL